MTALTRRRDHERQQEVWRVFYGDVQVGMIGERSGVPKHADQWEWKVGFYPRDHRSKERSPSGTAARFEQARVAWETAWRDYLPSCTDADFAENRRQRARTKWKYRMHDTGHLLPTSMAAGRSTCFCGTEITIDGAESHIETAHMDMA